MFTAYIERQMRRARYKILDDGLYFGSIPGLKGVWASAKTLEDCRAELQEVLEDWVMLHVRRGNSVFGLPIPKRLPVHA